MKELKLNQQICYYHPNNAYGVAMNLLNFGYGQFRTTYLYKNKETLKQLSAIADIAPPDINQLTGFTLNNLIDSIKIHICLENFLKGVFLIQRIVVHSIDKNIHKDLHEKQREMPVHIDELLDCTNWEDNTNLPFPDLKFRMQIKGIGKKTVGTNILMKEKYLESIGFNSSTASLFHPYLEYRNNLHYYTEESFTLTSKSYNNLERIINFVNSNVVDLQNKIVDILSKGDMYKLKTL